MVGVANSVLKKNIYQIIFVVKNSSLFFPTISDEENSYMKMTHYTDVVKGFSSLTMEQNKLNCFSG
jgi:hypothetical protein